MFPLLLVLAGVHGHMSTIWTNPGPARVDPHAAPSIDVYPMNGAVSASPKYTSTFLDITLQGMKPTTGHLLTLETPRNHFSIFPPAKDKDLLGCGHRILSSDSAHYYGCEVTTNAGFFDMSTGACIGNIVSKGVPVELPSTPTMRVNFGITSDGHFVMGYLPTSAAIRDLNHSHPIEELVQGGGYLVRNGSSFVDEAAKIEGISAAFVTERAPRTVIGRDAKGNLLLLEIDGSETKNIGPDLHQTAAIAMAHGFVSAVNLDGGGSSTYYLNGTLCSGCGELYAHCSSTSSADGEDKDGVSADGEDKDGVSADGEDKDGVSAECQRAVTTITCVH